MFLQYMWQSLSGFFLEPPCNRWVYTTEWRLLTFQSCQPGLHFTPLKRATRGLTQTRVAQAIPEHYSSCESMVRQAFAWELAGDEYLDKYLLLLVQRRIVLRKETKLFLELTCIGT